jgi:hypothetical protein
MKITLNELRQMVRNVLFEMDEKQYIASSEDNYMAITRIDDDEDEYNIVNTTSRIQEVVDLVKENADFTVTNCISFSSENDYDYENSVIERMEDIKEGKFKTNSGSYEYYIVEDSNGEQRILVSYYTNNYSEDFIFEGYLDEEDDEEEYRDEYPRYWTNPEEL